MNPFVLAQPAIAVLLDAGHTAPRRANNASMITMVAVLRHIDARTFPAYPKLVDTQKLHWVLGPNTNPVDGINKDRDEWIGDKVVNMIVGRLLYQSFEFASSAILTGINNVLVSNRVFARIAWRLGMASNPTIKSSADTFETYAHLLFVESSMTRLEPWILELFVPIVGVVTQVYADNQFPLVHRYHPSVTYSPPGGSRPKDLMSLLTGEGRKKKRNKNKTSQAQGPSNQKHQVQHKAVQRTTGPVRTQPNRRVKGSISVSPYSAEHRAKYHTSIKREDAPLPPAVPQQGQSSSTRFTEDPNGVMVLDFDSDDEIDELDDSDDADEMEVQETCFASETAIVMGTILGLESEEIEVYVPDHDIKGKLRFDDEKIEDTVLSAQGLAISWRSRKEYTIMEKGQLMVKPVGTRLHQKFRVGSEIKVKVTTETTGEFAFMEITFAHPWEQ